jgi:aminoglycoside phosphotransferase (APT) family kinase protein
MSLSAVEQGPLLALLPEPKLGTIEKIEPLTAGRSGAGVYAVTASRGAFVLRVQSRQLDDDYFAQQLRILTRAAGAGIAPPIVHVDDSARAIVSTRIAGLPLPPVLADPTQRSRALSSVVDGLRTLHGLDPAGVNVRDPLSYARSAYEAARHRPGFPAWATALEPTLTELGTVLERDARRVVSHNDVNPGNFLWDGAKAWLVDWEVAGLGHPHYDLATLALFLRLGDQESFELAALHDGAPLSEQARQTLLDLRRLVGLLAGLTFLGMVDDLNVRPCPARSDAPTLGDCYTAFRSGQYAMHSAYGTASMGLALLALGCA